MASFDAALPSPQRSLQYLCLFCLKPHRARDSLTQHLNRDHKEIFKKPFQCPECLRKDNDNTECFENKHDWMLHVSREHPANRTDSDIAFGTDYPDDSPSSPSLNSLRTKRQKVTEFNVESDSEVQFPALPQCERSSTASLISSADGGEESETFQVRKALHRTRLIRSLIQSPSHPSEEIIKGKEQSKMSYPAQRAATIALSSLIAPL